MEQLSGHGLLNYPVRKNKCQVVELEDGGGDKMIKWSR